MPAILLLRHTDLATCSGVQLWLAAFLVYIQGVPNTIQGLFLLPHKQKLLLNLDRFPPV